MIKSAITDVISPTVAAEDPDGLLGQVILVFEHSGGQRVVGNLLELCHICGGSLLGSLCIHAALDPVERCSRQLIADAGRHDLERVGQDLAADSLVTEQQAHAMLGVVLEQRVVPSGAMAVLVDRVRRRPGRVAPNRRAAGGIGDEHAVTEQLRDQTCVRSLGAACT